MNNLKIYILEHIVLVGERDLEDNKVTIKNMETGEQELVAIDDVADYIKKEI